MALMAGYTPIATILLAVLVPLFEPVGFSKQSKDTLIGFNYTPEVSILHFYYLMIILFLDDFCVLPACAASPGQLALQCKHKLSLQAVGAIALTCLLGLIVSLSTFLVIGATSSVTYNGEAFLLSK